MIYAMLYSSFSTRFQDSDKIFAFFQSVLGSQFDIHIRMCSKSSHLVDSAAFFQFHACEIVNFSVGFLSDYVCESSFFKVRI